MIRISEPQFQSKERNEKIGYSKSFNIINNMIGHNSNISDFTKPLSLKNGISLQRATDVFDRITSAGKALLNTTDVLLVVQWTTHINTEFGEILETSSGEYSRMLMDILSASQQLNGSSIGLYRSSAYTLNRPSCTSTINRVLDIITDVRTKIIVETEPQVSKNLIQMETKGQVDEKKIPNRKVFIVHGHDNEMKIDVAECLRKLEFEPIILNEKASRSMTIIEKLEHHSDVEFAVILLSPCDEGRKRDTGEYSARARQNVILELGYFIGKIGRKNTCSLLKESVEAPSDFTGIVYTSFDSIGAWKMELAKELKAAGFAVDMNKL